MNITNKYLETIFNPLYFAEELFLTNRNKTIYCIRDENQTASYDNFSVVGTGNRITIKSTDYSLYKLQEEEEISLASIDYIIKSIENNNNGTITLVIERK